MGSTTCVANKEQALVILVVQQLVDAQFVRANQTAAERLWQEVAALDLSIDRVINLLYSALDFNKRDALRAEDNAWVACHQVRPPRRGPLRSWRLSRSR